MLLGVGLVALQRSGRGPWSEGASASPGVPDSIARLAPGQALRRGVELGTAGRHRESLPYFHRALASGRASLSAHLNYAIALQNAALEVRAHLGRAEPATRSSLERVTMMRESLRQLELAEPLARTPAERAQLRVQRSHRYLTWGMPWDALVEARRAQELAPQRIEWAEWLVKVLEHPERPESEGPGDAREVHDGAAREDRR